MSKVSGYSVICCNTNTNYSKSVYCSPDLDEATAYAEMVHHHHGKDYTVCLESASERIREWARLV